MRCTSCSQEVKPIVAIDIDGVLGDYHGHFLRFACEYWGHNLEKLLQLSLNMYDGSIPFREYFAVAFGVSIKDYRKTKLAYRQGGMKRSMPITEGASHLCDAVRGESELWLTTTRPYLSLDGVIEDTMFWLDLHQIRYDGLLFDDEKYKVLIQRVDPERIVAIVDDLDEMYDAASNLYGESIPILYLNKYNKVMGRGRTVVRSLQEAERTILSKLRQWQNKHQRDLGGNGNDPGDRPQRVEVQEG